MGRFLRSDAVKVTGFLVVVVLLGALLAPPLYWFGQWITEKGWLEGTEVGESIERAKITRYFNRALQGSVLLLAYPFIRWLGVKRGSNWLLLEKNPDRWRHLGTGFAVGALTLLVLGGIYLLVGWYRIGEREETLMQILVAAGLTAVAVALLEEFLFRGALFGVLLRTLSPFRALLFLSALFAVLHFLRPPKKLALPPVEWDTGFWVLGKIFAQFTEVADFLLPQLLLLFAVGWVLGYVRLKTKSLWMGIGLHSGWVFGMKVFKDLAKLNAEPKEMLPWAGPTLQVGVLSVLMVILSGILIRQLLRKRYPRSAFGEAG